MIRLHSAQFISFPRVISTKSLAFAAVLYKITACENNQPGHSSSKGTAMIKLTARQEQILNLIRDAIENTGFPPTRAEIAAELGFRSANAAEEHLQALARKGAIEISPGTSRGIRLRDMGAGRNSERFPSGQMALPHPALMQLSLPLVGRVAAGSPILAQEHIEKSFNVDPSLFSAKPDYLLKVRGMSMRDAGIFDGDLLAVKKTDQARNGQIIVARLGDDVTVKRYRKTGSLIELLPENPDFEPIRVEPQSEDFALEGLAVGLLRNWG
jgi:repressor LexA